MSSMAEPPRLELEWLPGRYAMCRLPARTPTPAWATAPGPLLSITHTRLECSIVVPVEHVPAGVRSEGDWVALSVVGPLAFDLVGVLAQLAGALAVAGIPLCAISTYDTDILLIKADQASRAASVLAAVASVPPPPSSRSAI